MYRTSDEMSTENPKGVDSIVPIEIWYRRECTDQVMGVSRPLNIIL